MDEDDLQELWRDYKMEPKQVYKARIAMDNDGDRVWAVAVTVATELPVSQNTLFSVALYTYPLHLPLAVLPACPPAPTTQNRI